MLHLTSKGQAQTCDGMTRRDFLQVGSLGAIGLSLPDLLAAQAQGAVAKEHDERSVILIFNLGAPSQVDLFDMKPEAPAEIRGPFKPIKTKAPGMEISEILPLHAQHADKFSLVRSCYHTAAAVHDTGHQMMQTGRLFTGGINTPHAGCALSYLRGRKSDLPAHVVLPEPMGPTGGNLPHGQDAGFLGKAHDPFSLMADPSQPNFKVPDLLPPAEIGEVRLERRRKLRAIVDETVDSFAASDNARLLDSNFEAAFRMMTSPQARAAFDLSKEPQAVRERYGMNRFGQCCLLSRRLIEAGTRLVTVVGWCGLAPGDKFLSLETWDMHGNAGISIFDGGWNGLGWAMPCADQAVSTLLEDLRERGLLESTLVVLVGEFGRTPKIGKGRAVGRDHWPNCYSAMLAGAGIRGGHVYGASDATSAYVKSKPVTLEDFSATMFHALGIDPATRLSPDGFTRPVSSGTPITQLF